jgi:hypothetical protein
MSQNQLSFTYSSLLSIGEVSIKKQGSNKHSQSDMDKENVQTIGSKWFKFSWELQTQITQHILCTGREMNRADPLVPILLLVQLAACPWDSGSGRMRAERERCA